ncbi:prolyl-tRNA synthetase associated domain-containing protein [Salinarimonas ramus]|uniref:Prolyl-tRNA editing protein n=1 Tax=Salinarimonas ramus TaxID=690164 RepID=A0A917Q7T5_9HYPH|nr:prolyl-tRNA synthetase associated domain-containing protein [Salinarimonas ramus]GGK34003.1 prolyl-tRNA editing protein [Salinarimonas ramus]
MDDRTHAPLDPQALFALLDRHGTPHSTVEHEAVFTVAQSQAIERDLPGGHTKNLFLKDKKGSLFLVTAEAHARVDLKRLHVPLGAASRLSFGSAELLREALGVEPGSVTPLALANDRAGRVRFFLDRTLAGFETINVHPLVNTMTTAIPTPALVAFLAAIGHAPTIVDLPTPPEEEASAPSP